ncbi:MAG: hypothetical protein V4850_34735 [Myxococcota bacterium]
MSQAAQAIGACYPGTLCEGPTADAIAFSRPAISHDGSYALVYRVYDCGVLCASGTWILLRNHNGRWEFVHSWTEWMS